MIRQFALICRLRGVQRIAGTIALVLMLSGGAFAQKTCSPGLQPGGQAVPLWNWHLFNKGALPQSVFYHLNEDLLQFTIEDGARLNLRDDQVSISISSNTYLGLINGNQISGWNCVYRSPTISLVGWSTSS